MQVINNECTSTEIHEMSLTTGHWFRIKLQVIEHPLKYIRLINHSMINTLPSRCNSLC